MKIKEKIIDRVPGGLMLVPLFIGVICNTVSPGAGAYFGSFTNGIMHGVVPILSVWFFCIGATISLKSTGTVLRKSGVLVVTKLIVAWLVAIVASRWLPTGGIMTGLFAGFSVLTVVAAMDMTNGGLYASIMEQYGTKEEAGAFILTSIESGPLMTMIILGMSGVAVFQTHTLLGAVLPFIIGFALGNLDPDLKAFFSKGMQLLIPFFGFALGNGISLGVLREAGFAGIILSLFVIVITGIPLIFADRLIGGGDGTAGLAASSTAGAAAATPLLIANVSPQFQSIAPLATALVATSTLVTAILVPIITGFYSNWVKKTGKKSPVNNN